MAVEDRPDVVVVNTCSVTDHADAKCRNIVRRAKAANPDSFVAVIGCYAQLKPKEIAEIDGVDLVLGAQEKFNLAGHLESQRARKASGDDAAVVERGEIRDVSAFHPAVSSGDRTRSFLKVQDGCDYFCAFAPSRCAGTPPAVRTSPPRSSRRARRLRPGHGRLS